MTPEAPDRPLPLRLRHPRAVATVTLLALGLGGFTAVKAVGRYQDRQHCEIAASSPASPDLSKLAVQLCTEGRQNSRNGPLGLFPSDKGRAAGRCGAEWARVEQGAKDFRAYGPEAGGPSQPPGDSPEARKQFMDYCIAQRIG